jgi:hypothetical protein
MTQIIEHINMQGKTFDVEPPLDQQAIQNSQQGISSGGAWQALQDMSPTKNKEIAGMLFSRLMGRVWDRPTAGQSYQFYSAIHAGGKYIACSNHGAFYSLNAKDWFQCAGGTSVTFNKIVYTGSLYLAATSAGIFKSGDGMVWSLSNDNVSNTVIKDIFYYNYTAVIATTTGLYYCQDLAAPALSWTQVSNVSSLTFNFVCFSDGLWMAGSLSNGLWWSENGTTWTQGTGPTTGSFNCAHCLDGFWIAGSTGAGLYWSTDGKAWAQGTGPTTYTFNSIAYYNGLYVAASTSHGMYYSADGKVWTQCTGCTSYTMNSVRAYSGAYIAASSSGGSWFSIDGVNWGQSVNKSGTVNCISYCDGVWIAGGTGLYICDIDTLFEYGVLTA